MPALARSIAVFLSAISLAACQEDGPNASTTDFSTPDLVETTRAACERDGGSWGRRGSSLFVCYQPTADANQQCRAASDCESVCLARSGTCAPTKPFLGCHEVLTDAGLRATQCIN